MGIDAFKHFRYIINKLIPTKKELISEMIEKRGVKEYPFALFIEEYKPQIDLSVYDAVYDITDDIKLCTKNHIITKMEGSLEDKMNYHAGFIILNNENKKDFVEEWVPERHYLHRGYYKWDECFVYRYVNEKVVALYDILNKKVIKDKNEINSILNSKKKSLS